MPIHGLVAAMRLGEQMRRVWWGNSLRCEMTPNIQIRGIFPFLNCLMMCARFANCFLLYPDALVQCSIARFKFGPDALNIFFDNRKFSLGGNQFFFGKAGSIRTAEPGPNQFRPLFRKAARRALILIDWVSRSAGGGVNARRSDSCFNRARSAASFSWIRRSTAANSRSQRSTVFFA